MKACLERTGHPYQRSRRGLFDFLGKVASTLSRVATNDDITSVDDATQQLSNQVFGVVKAHNCLVGHA